MTRKRTWTPDEDQVVRETMSLPLAQVAARLPGRTVKSVSDRRSRIRGTTRPTVKGAASVARGRASWLIAKTCPECGVLRMAREYPQRSRGGWAHACVHCIPRVTRPYHDRDQADTRLTADHHYQPWTLAEYSLATATRSDGRWRHSVRDAARETGRTSAAVQQLRSMHRNALRDAERRANAKDRPSP